MNQPKTLSLLYECLEKEYAWRITELSNFKSTVLLTKGKAQDGLIRAGVALLYAHWEGFIKKVADLYYEFVSYQNCTIGELNDCFVSMALRAEMETLETTKKLTKHTEAIKAFFNRETQQASFLPTSPIKTSNLRYDVFEDVCLLIGIDMSVFHQRYRDRGYRQDIERTINNDLVDKRNFIAHGEYLPIKEKDYKELYEIIVNGFLYIFKELVMDNAQNKTYLR
ncbi:MAG: hypothetical protein EAZ95_00160 [Bacteroidetes bacterium]|nr:MAG: hypothetical protein EAZ95_00160 [Bacteroidota bacterium]